MDASVLRAINVFAMVVVLVVAIFTDGITRTAVEVPQAPRIDRSVVPMHVPGATVPFREELTARHWVVGLIQGEQPDFGKHLRKYIRPGDRIARIGVMTRRTAVDLLLSLVTLGIYVPVTVTVEGEIVRPA
jgi:hypothetical protein